MNTKEGVKEVNNDARFYNFADSFTSNIFEIP